MGGTSDTPHPGSYHPQFDTCSPPIPVFAFQTIKKFANHQVSDNLDRDNIYHLQAA